MILKEGYSNRGERYSALAIKRIVTIVGDICPSESAEECYCVLRPLLAVSGRRVH